MKKPLIIVLAVVAGFLLVGLLINMANKPADKSSTDTSTAAPAATTTDNSSAQQKTTTPSDDTASAITTITYSNGSFSPKSITIKAGDTIEIKNTGGDLSFNSDPHPSHTNNPELNAGVITSGSSKKITVSNKGTWGYHNHLNSSETGTIIVQ